MNPALRRVGSVAWLALLSVLQMSTAVAADAPANGQSRPADIEFFTRERCPHCDDAKRFVDELARTRPDLLIVSHDVVEEPASAKQLEELASRLAVGAPGVPAFLVRGELIIGFAGSATTGTQIAALLDRAQTARTSQAPGLGSCRMEDDLSCGPQDQPPGAAGSIIIPLIGVRVTVQDLGLPLFTAAIGLLDGFNPCSMWVLILMISMLASLNNRRRMLVIGGTFVAVEGLAYFAFMAAWLNLFFFIGLSRVSEIVLGVIACFAGIVNMKDFWAYGRGVSLSIPAAAKPGLYARMRGILQAEQVTGAVLGAVVLALLVQLVELLCTSGFPALYTRILTLQQLDPASYYGYLLLYNLFYMLDDVVVLGLGVMTLSQRRLQQQEGRWLKLLSGAVMSALGLYLLAAPR